MKCQGEDRPRLRGMVRIRFKGGGEKKRARLQRRGEESDACGAYENNRAVPSGGGTSISAEEKGRAKAFPWASMTL